MKRAIGWVSTLALAGACGAAGDNSPGDSGGFLPGGTAANGGQFEGNAGSANAGTGASSGQGGAGNGGLGNGGSGAGTSSSACDGSVAGQPALRRLNRRELESTVREIFPILGAEWRSGLSADTVSERGFDNDNELLVVSRQTARDWASTAQTIGEAVAANIAQVLPCSATTPGVNCASEFLNTTGRRVFRRPLEQAEVDAFIDFFNTAQAATGDFAAGVGWLTRALIESPHFVYRRELGVQDGAVFRLSAYEIATELAFTFTGTGPTEALLDRAAAGDLSSPAVLQQTARELLLGAGRGVIQNFFDSYVGHSRVTSIAKAQVPQFAGLRNDMLQESRDFIAEVVINRVQGVRELLTAEFTTPSVELAAYYELQQSPAQDGAITPRNPGEGIGLFAQGAVLATLAQPDGSSPTKRGLWVYERMLCNTVPSPPPDIPDLQPPQPGERTTRQRYEEDHAQGFCQGCHAQWDPIGFGFEHFDETGKFRANESGLTIDASSTVPYLGEALFEFDGQEDLMRQLVEQPIVHECLSGYLTSYAFGEEFECVGESQRAGFVDGSVGIVDYLASLAAEPHFTERRVGVE